MVWKKILLKIALFFLSKGLEWAFREADENKDGVLTKDEVWNFTVDKLNTLYKRVK